MVRVSGSADVAKILIDAGADVNARNFASETPLHWSVSLTFSYFFNN